MTIKYLFEDEMFPVFYLSDNKYYGRKIEVSEDFLHRYNSVLQEFDDLQETLSNLYDKAIR